MEFLTGNCFERLLLSRIPLMGLAFINLFGFEVRDRSFNWMKRPKFQYNNTTASCLFCDRTHNPHPDFKHEPIVTTRLMIKQKEKELCINCYYEMLAVANSSNKHVMAILEEKLNLLRIFKKQKNSLPGFD